MEACPGLHLAPRLGVPFGCTVNMQTQPVTHTEVPCSINSEQGLGHPSVENSSDLHACAKQPRGVLDCQARRGPIRVVGGTILPLSLLFLFPFPWMEKEEEDRGREIMEGKRAVLSRILESGRNRGRHIKGEAFGLMTQEILGQPCVNHTVLLDLVARTCGEVPDLPPYWSEPPGDVGFARVTICQSHKRG